MQKSSAVNVCLEDHLSIVGWVVSREMARGVMPWVDRSDLEDVAQMALVESGAKYDGRCPFEAFAYRAVRSAVLNEIRRLGVRNRGRDEVRSATSGDESSEGDQWDATVYGKQNLCPVRVDPNLFEVMAKVLSAQENRVVALLFWGSFTQAQAAAEMGVDQATVSRILKSAKKSLRACINGGSQLHT
jgi:RNA polymerase sigma factor (sigma-70 family)